MNEQTDSQSRPLQDELLVQINELICEAEATSHPLEMDPARSQLFELFVTAHGAGFLAEEAEIDLTADALCKKLAQNWGLDEAAQDSAARQENLGPEHLSKMRLLWSVMRMWMEWTYAWSRWEEFRDNSAE